MSSKAIETLSPLAAELRANDPDRFTATLFAPPACRESLIALYAFDFELARIRTSVSEPMAGLIRLQWWEDVVDNLDNDGMVVRHPVVQGLHRAVVEGGLDRRYLKQALDGRRRPFEEDVAPSLQAFERYLVDIGGGIARAAVALLGVDRARTLGLVDRIGLVRAAWEQLCLLKRLTNDQRPWVPSEWLGERSADRGTSSVEAAATGLADWALQQLSEARLQKGDVTRPMLAAFFPATLAGRRLRDPSGRAADRSLPSAVPTLIWCWLRRRF